MVKLILLVALSRVRRFSSLTSDLNNLLSSRHLFDFLTRNGMRLLKSIQASTGENGHENFLLSQSKLLTLCYPAICPLTILIIKIITPFNLVSNTTSPM